jgi:hypothetical protein
MTTYPFRPFEGSPDFAQTMRPLHSLFTLEPPPIRSIFTTIELYLVVLSAKFEPSTPFAIVTINIPAISIDFARFTHGLVLETRVLESSLQIS